MSIYEQLVSKPRKVKPIVIGEKKDGSPIELDYESQLQFHTHLIGLSGRGKSRAIEYILRQFILDRVGFTLIDPHGDIYEALVCWLTRQREGFLSDRKIHLFDPAHPRWRFGYNPLRIPDGTPIAVREAIAMDRVEAVMEAVSQVMGGENTEQMPLYQRTFSTILYTLATHGLTIFEAMRLLPASEEAFREYLARDLPDEVARLAWLEMHSWKLKDYSQNVASLYNRLHRMMRHPFVRQILAQTKNTLDVRKVMDDGDIVLANFQPRPGFPDANADLLARLLLCDYTQTARSRPANQSRPHFLVIDECYRYLTSDIERILDQTRKYGLHLMLAHQRLSQLGKPGEPIYEGVMEGAQNKLIFGTSYQSALELADRFLSHEYDLERPKHSMDRSVQVGVTRTIMHGKTRTNTEGDTWSEGVSSMVNAVTAHGYRFDADGNQFGSYSEAQAYGVGEGTSVARGGVSTFSEGVSEQESFEPVYRILPTQLHDLSEERHLKAVEIAKLGQQSLIVRAADLQRYDGQTVTYQRSVPSFEAVQACYEKLFELDPFNTEIALVEEELRERRASLGALMSEVGSRNAPEPEEPDEHKDVEWR